VVPDDQKDSLGFPRTIFRITGPLHPVAAACGLCGFVGLITSTAHKGPSMPFVRSAAADMNGGFRTFAAIGTNGSNAQ